MDSLRLQIFFQDRVGFVYDVSRVITTWNLNIVSIEIVPGSLFLYLTQVSQDSIEHLLTELRLISGVTGIAQVQMMPSEEREYNIRAVLHSVSEGVVAIDARGIITTLNPVAEHIFKASAAELLGGKITEVISREAPLLSCLDKGLPYNYKEVSINTPRGKLNFLSTGRPIKDDRGNITGAVACIKDMSDVKQLVNTVTTPATISFDEIFGISSSLKKVIEFAKMVSYGDSTVLIRGESGTGKELFARAIHTASSRSAKPFVPLNCAALPENLLESELFGYVEGAFSGARKGGKIGLLEFADHGTLFLDEIGELSPHLQAKLLRVIQDGKVRRIGSSVEVKVNVRLIAATNRNIEEMIKQGSFREDLYYRLNVVPIFLPPLRQRTEDIPLLVVHSIHKLNARLNKKVEQISPDANAKLMRYNWPGNIRELENVIERAMILTQGPEIQAEGILLDQQIVFNVDEILGDAYKVDITNESDGRSKNLIDIIAQYERNLLLQELKKHRSIRKAAKALGVSHTTMLNKIKKYNLAFSPE